MRLTAQSVPHAQMGRPEVVGMARAKKKKPEQQQAAGPLTSSPAPAEDVEGTLVHGFLKMLFSSYMYLHVGKSLLVFEALYGAKHLPPFQIAQNGGNG